MATPAALAAADATLTTAEASATVQIAAAIIVTAILCPILVSFVDRWERKRHPDRYADLDRQKAEIGGDLV